MEFKVVRNDIALMEVDVIVLPANPELKEGSGASHAIYEKAGRRELNEACRKAIKKYQYINVGNAIPTPAFNLPSNYIIHTVVPKYVDGRHREYELLSEAYLSALYLADIMECESIAFPLLASGYNRFNLDLAYEIAKKSIEAYIPCKQLKEIILVVYSTESMELMHRHGVAVEQEIDDLYVLNKDDVYRPEHKKALHDAKRFVEKKFDENKDKIIEEAIKIASDPEKRKKFIETAGFVVNMAKGFLK